MRSTKEQPSLSLTPEENPLVHTLQAAASCGEYGLVREMITDAPEEHRDVLCEEAAVAASWRGDFLISASFVEQVRDESRLIDLQERLRLAERGFQEYLASL